MRFNLRRRRAGLSEILGSLIMLAITLVAGASVFGFVNGQAGSSAQAVGVNAASNINFLNEREVVVYAAMNGLRTSTVWVYNSGSINPETFTNIVVYDTSTPNVVCTVVLSPSASVTKATVASVALTLPTLPTTGCPAPFIFVTTHSYNFLVVGQFGSTAQLTVKF